MNIQENRLYILVRTNTYIIEKESMFLMLIFNMQRTLKTKNNISKDTHILYNINVAQKQNNFKVH